MVTDINMNRLRHCAGLHNQHLTYDLTYEDSSISVFEFADPEQGSNNPEEYMKVIG